MNTNKFYQLIFEPIQILQCKYLQGSTYDIGELGQSECKNGFVPIRSESRCDEARKGLDIQIFRGEQLMDNEARLPYCWIGAGGAANYNPKDNQGNNGGVAKLICEKGGKFYFILTQKRMIIR